MRLLYGPLSMFSAKAAIAIREKGLECAYEAVPFSLADRYEPKHPEVLRHNPKSQVPVLFDGDIVLYDSTQIFEYLEDAYPSPPLWPEKLDRKVEARRLEMEADEVLFPHVVTLIVNVRTLESEAAKLARAGIASAYDRFEKQLRGREYLVEQFTYADIALVCAHYFAAFLGADLAARHAELLRWRRTVATRPSANCALGSLGGFLTSNGLNAPAFDQ